jgi:hypothetical protein
MVPARSTDNHCLGGRSRRTFLPGIVVASTLLLGGALACGLLAMTSEALRLKLLGVGAMSSPRYAPAGLLILHSAGNVMLDGGHGAEPDLHRPHGWSQICGQNSSLRSVDLHALGP